MTRTHSADEVRALDMEMGGDDDMPGIPEELSVDDIDDVAFDSNVSVDERREDLMNMLAEIRARRTSDLMGDMAGIASHLEYRIASLENPLESETLIESTGMETDSRSDDDDHVDDEDEDLRVQDLAPKQI